MYRRVVMVVCLCAGADADAVHSLEHIVGICLCMYIFKVALIAPSGSRIGRLADFFALSVPILHY